MNLVKLCCTILMATAVALFAISCAAVTSEPAMANQPSRPIVKVIEEPAAMADEADDLGDMVISEATIENVQINIMESFPLQAAVQVQGYLSDGCTRLGEATVEREGNVFIVTLPTQRPADAICTQALVDFEENIPLDILGLEVGEYTVKANGAKSTFSLTQYNAMPEGY